MSEWVDGDESVVAEYCPFQDGDGHVLAGGRPSPFVIAAPDAESARGAWVSAPPG